MVLETIKEELKNSLTGINNFDVAKAVKDSENIPDEEYNVLIQLDCYFFLKEIESRCNHKDEFKRNSELLEFVIQSTTKNDEIFIDTWKEILSRVNPAIYESLASVTNNVLLDGFIRRCVNKFYNDICNVSSSRLLETAIIDVAFSYRRNPELDYSFKDKYSEAQALVDSLVKSDKRLA